MFAVRHIQWQSDDEYCRASQIGEKGCLDLSVTALLVRRIYMFFVGGEFGLDYSFSKQKWQTGTFKDQ
jgi:hypothetical protein